MSHPDAPDGTVTTDRITLRDYVRTVDIGAFQSEHGAPQRLRFAISLEVAPPDLGDDDVDEILSYDTLVEAVDVCLRDQRFDLLETLAEQIAAHCLRHSRARWVSLSIEKLDRGPFALGVELERTRPSAVPFVVPQPSVAAPWVVSLSVAAMQDGRLSDWVAQLAAHGAPLVLAVAPLAGRPRTLDAPTAQLQIDLLSQDQAAWLLAARLPDCNAAVSRTEIDAVLREGRIAVWAPSRLVLRAGAEAQDISGPAGQAAWLAGELYAHRLLGVGVDIPGGTRLALDDRLGVSGGTNPVRRAV